jgi:hypothetical protein
MTLADVEATLPNGFHDAEIMELVWNYQTNSASDKLSFSGRNMDKGVRDRVILKKTPLN